MVWELPVLLTLLERRSSEPREPAASEPLAREFRPPASDVDRVVNELERIW